MSQKEKSPEWAIGTMSGTSMDGVDIAMLLSDGVDIYDFGPVVERPFDEAERRGLRRALGAWPGEAGVDEAAEIVLRAHAEALSSEDLAERSSDAIIGFHGQTLAHDPIAGRTHQTGDGAALATLLGREVVWDFRSADMKLGGQGAPLAPFYHWACARYVGATEPIAFLNMGGVGNISWIDPRIAAPELPGACLAFDTGPANAPIDDLMLARGLGSFDEDGELAARGQVDATISKQFLATEWFDLAPPKSLDRDAFAGLLDAVSELSDADALATLTACSASAVGRAMDHLPAAPRRILVTGGGRKNATLMQNLETATACEVVPVEAVGLNGDALEAQAFAYLALRVVNGLPTSAPGTTGVATPIGGARRSRPT